MPRRSGGNPRTRRGRSAAWWALVMLAVVAGCLACGAPPGEPETTPPGEPETAPFDPVAAERAVRAVLSQQVAAWNDGDIDAFMAGYWHDPRLRFASGDQITSGWQETLERYHQRYPDRAAMGELAFEEIDIRVLSPQWAIAFGRWRLERENDRPGGLFTLLFERRAEGWRIVHDHTSAGG